MKLTIIGTGYVGLVSGTCFAEMGHDVVCVDIDELKIQKLNAGQVPIYEPELDILLERNLKQKRIRFTTDLSDGIQNAEVIFLALPTPSGSDGSADLQYVLQVAQDLSRKIRQYTVIVNKSTVPVGTSEKLYAVLAKSLDPSLFDVVSNPEFLREGVAVSDFLRPDRVVIGCASQKAQKIMDELYQPFVRQGNPIYFMDLRSAEMTKYAANAYLAMRISYMNEMANLCEKLGANVDMVRIGMGSDSRIGKRFLFPGVGYGGSCFPKDVKALARKAREYEYPFRILQAVMEVNEEQKKVLSRKVKSYFGPSLQGRRFGIWGLAFKPETDDIREAPSLIIIEELLEAGAEITAFDPEAMDNVRAQLGDRIRYGADPYQVVEGADALIIVTEWGAFRNPDFERIRQSLNQPVIFDGRNLFIPERMEELGFYYESIGRRTAHADRKPTPRAASSLKGNSQNG